MIEGKGKNQLRFVGGISIETTACSFQSAEYSVWDKISMGVISFTVSRPCDSNSPGRASLWKLVASNARAASYGTNMSSMGYVRGEDK